MRKKTKTPRSRTIALIIDFLSQFIGHKSRAQDFHLRRSSAAQFKSLPARTDRFPQLQEANSCTTHRSESKQKATKHTARPPKPPASTLRRAVCPGDPRRRIGQGHQTTVTTRVRELRLTQTSREWGGRMRRWTVVLPNRMGSDLFSSKPAQNRAAVLRIYSWEDPPGGRYL